MLDAPGHTFRAAHDVVYELAVKLTHVFWRRLHKPTLEQADAHFSNVIYDLVRQGNYGLAQALADFGATTLKPPVASDYSKRSLVVNRAQAYIWGGKKAEGLAILNAEDWSASRDEFHVCVHALRSQFDDAVLVMRRIGASGRPGKADYREWPVFQEL